MAEQTRRIEMASTSNQNGPVFPFPVYMDLIISTLDMIHMITGRPLDINQLGIKKVYVNKQLHFVIWDGTPVENKHQEELLAFILKERHDELARRQQNGEANTGMNTQNESCNQLSPRGKRPEVPLYNLNLEDYRNDPVTYKKIQRAQSARRFHEGRKNEREGLRRENDELRKLVTGLKGKVLEMMAIAGETAFSQVDLNILNTEVPPTPSSDRKKYRIFSDESVQQQRERYERRLASRRATGQPDLQQETIMGEAPPQTPARGLVPNDPSMQYPSTSGLRNLLLAGSGQGVPTKRVASQTQDAPLMEPEGIMQYPEVAEPMPSPNITMAGGSIPHGHLVSSDVGLWDSLPFCPVHDDDDDDDHIMMHSDVPGGSTYSHNVDFQRQPAALLWPASIDVGQSSSFPNPFAVSDCGGVTQYPESTGQMYSQNTAGGSAPVQGPVSIDDGATGLLENPVSASANGVNPAYNIDPTPKRRKYKKRQVPGTTQLPKKRKNPSKHVSVNQHPSSSLNMTSSALQDPYSNFDYHDAAAAYTLVNLQERRKKLHRQNGEHNRSNTSSDQAQRQSRQIQGSSENGPASSLHMEAYGNVNGYDNQMERVIECIDISSDTDTEERNLV